MNQNLFSFTFTCLSLFSLWVFHTAGANLVMLLLAFVYAYLFPSKIDLIVSSFLIGFFSDIVLNVYSHRYDGKGGSVRSARLRYYFRKEGTIQAAIFAGLLVVWMTLASLVFSDGSMRWDLIITGFLVGAFLGIFAEDSKAIKNLKPFYDSTSGRMENRIWDGLSMSWVFIVLVGIDRLRERKGK